MNGDEGVAETEDRDAALTWEFGDADGMEDDADKPLVVVLVGVLAVGVTAGLFKLIVVTGA